MTRAGWGIFFDGGFSTLVGGDVDVPTRQRSGRQTANVTLDAFTPAESDVSTVGERASGR